MIKFVYIGDQMTGDGAGTDFAWYDTNKEEFLCFSGAETWESWESFAEYADPYPIDFMDFKALFPDPFPPTQNT